MYSASPFHIWNRRKFRMLLRTALRWCVSLIWARVICTEELCHTFECHE